ncbi:MAG: hypothetical protein ACRDT6_01375 [Micromonosporaceae bacterium]
MRTESTRLRTTRQALSYAAILGTVPYLTLKFCWLVGIPVGINDPAFMHDTGVFLLNLFTAGMDVYAIALALVFARGWRAPAPLVLFPVWVGTGFLAPIVAGVPVVGVISLLAPPAPAASGNELPLAPWVQPLVYVGFAWQGVCLLTAFLLYAVDRWSPVFTARIADTRDSGWAPLGYLGVALAVVTTAVHLGYATGLDIGLSAGEVAGRTAVGRGVETIRGLAAAAGAAGVLALLLRAPRRWRFWVPVVLAWTGAGAMFSWGFWALLNIAGSTLLVSGGVSGFHLATAIVQTLGGLLLGGIALRHAATTRSASPSPAHVG